MTREELIRKIDELYSDTDFTKKLSGCSSAEEIANLLNASGIKVSTEDVEAALVNVSAEKESGEISESDLEGITGGRHQMPSILIDPPAFKKKIIYRIMSKKG